MPKDLLPPPMIQKKLETVEEVETFIKGLLAYLEALRQQIGKNLS